MNETNPMNKPAAGGKLSTIFLVVLGLHVVLIVCFLAYSMLKGDARMDDTAYITDEPSAPSSYMTDAEPAPSDGGPLVVTDADPTHDGRLHDAFAGGMPMPASDDPVWTRVPEPAPRGPAPVSPRDPAPSVARGVTPEVVAPAPASVRTPTPEPARSATHTVVSGDSLHRIARNHNTTVDAIRSANKLSGDMIRIGQELVIPGSTAAQTQTVARRATPVSASAPASSGFINHTVERGDTLWGVAQKYSISAAELARVNGIDDPSRLRVGAVLKIPVAGGERQDVATPPAPRGPSDMAMSR